MDKEKKYKIKLTLIRHGSTRLNEEKRYMGWIDEELSENGKKMLVAKKNLYEGYDLVFASPMLRCRQTADILFLNRDVKIIDNWKEMNFGKFDGKNYKELSDDIDYKVWIDSGCMGQIPGGEKMSSFVERSMNGLDIFFDICEAYMPKYDISKKAILNAAAVVHGGTIMALLGSLTDNDYFDLIVGNGEGYELLFEDKKLISYRLIKDNNAL